MKPIAVLAITRLQDFTRNPEVHSADYLFTDYVRGTEEQLIDKPEILCETL